MNELSPIRLLILIIAGSLLIVGSGRAAPVAITIVSGDEQVRGGGISGESAPFEPLRVRVLDESGAPVRGVTVRFAAVSPGGNLVVEGGSERLATTDASGLASWEGLLVVTSGTGMFNVMVSLAPPLDGTAVFLLSRNDSVCVLPFGVPQTESELIAQPNPVAQGATVTLTARFGAYFSPAQPRTGVAFAYSAITSSGRLLAARRLSPSDGSVLAATVNLGAGMHVLKSRISPSCEYRGSESPPLALTVTSGLRPAIDYTDMWWKPAESGWGISVVQHATGQLFVVWFHYREDGSPQWLVIPGGVWTSVTSFTGAVYRTSGPAFAGVFDPSRVTILPVGVATLGFSAFDRGTFTWSMDGVQGVKSIQRQSF